MADFKPGDRARYTKEALARYDIHHWANDEWDITRVEGTMVFGHFRGNPIAHEDARHLELIKALTPFDKEVRQYIESEIGASSI